MLLEGKDIITMKNIFRLRISSLLTALGVASVSVSPCFAQEDNPELTVAPKKIMVTSPVRRNIRSPTTPVDHLNGLMQGVLHQSQFYTTRAAFTWEILPRFGQDLNGNGIPDLPNTREYVLNLPEQQCKSIDCDAVIPKFDLIFDASPSIVRRQARSSSDLTVRYRWRIEGASLLQPIEHFTEDKQWATSLPEGEYRVTLDLDIHPALPITGQTIANLTSPSVSSQLIVEDILIVALGDSFSSGEGNPERTRNSVSEAKWADDGTYSPDSDTNKRHRRAHRSTLAWPAQAALSIEKANNRTSVTFVSLATTGAKIGSGILGTAPGAKLEPFIALPPQLEELKQLVGKNRRIDILTLSIGGNDVGFANIVQALLLANESEDFVERYHGTKAFARKKPWEQRIAVIEAFYSGDWSKIIAATEDRCIDCVGLTGLHDGYRMLKEALNQAFPGRIGSVYVMGYPDPTGHLENGAVVWCQNIVADMVGPSGFISSIVSDIGVPDTEIGKKEEDVLANHILRPLNETIAQAAYEAGWKFLELSEFASHGYCAAYPVLRPGDAYYFALGNPYPNEVPPSDEQTSWFRTASQSRVVQGPTGYTCDRLVCMRDAIETAGTLHPNELGHQAAKRRLLEVITPP